MTAARPFRFLAGATDAVDARALAARARRAEAIGGSAPVIPDRLLEQELGELDSLVERLAGT